MPSTLVNSLTDTFRSQALGLFVAKTGESESSIIRGFEGSVGVLVAGLATKAEQAGFGRQIMELVNSPGNDPKILENARGLIESPANNSLGSRLTSMVLGDRQSTITDAIGVASGLRPTNVATLLGAAAPLVLGFLAHRVRQGGMDASRLTSFLSEEAAGVRGALPAGVRSVLGTEIVPNTVPPVASGVVPEKSRGWLWPLVIAAAVLLALLWWFSSRRVNTQPVQDAAAATADLVTRTLPGNVDLHIPAGRMEDNLLGFIQDSSKQPDETTWFDFDRLLFDTNSATLQPASQEQLRNVAAILKAYPNVHVKIGGYTDNTGDASANQLLSQRRADSVKQQLIDMGISADRLEAQGYGEEHPVADNSLADGRQKNRRISLRVTQK